VQLSFSLALNNMWIVRFAKIERRLMNSTIFIKLRMQHWLIFLILIGSVPVWSMEPIQPLPAKVTVNSAKANLGKQLFFETSLSKDRSISCASCHDLGAWGAESLTVSKGIKNQIGTRNAPTIFNSSFNFKQFWDGRADSLSHQAEMPVTDPVEMGMGSWEEAVERISSDERYNSSFERIYSGDVSRSNIVDAIAEFEKTLVTPNSPFDRYLQGDEGAINGNQKRGYELFKSYGCVSCHQGVNVGGNMFQKFGVLEDISLNEKNLAEDLGRYSVTKNEWDKRVFKVPSLRLAVKTPPYFHNGSIKTIEEAVDIMVRFQLGRDVPEEDRNAIIAFLESLVGTKPQTGILQ